MKEQYITITGMNHYYGMKPFSVGKKIRCYKEPDNSYDTEAIKVTMKEIGTVGYVANSPLTTAMGTMSAGRIYDRVGHKFVAEVLFITSSKVICKVLDEETNLPQKFVIKRFI
ncbi:MAG: HIRAN domain-containing protein [Anaerotignum sp.]|nr:HIRAN domain-containing protein [Anaerotignum sp.]